MSRNAPVFHCPYCGEDDLRPVAEPAGAWACGSCVRVFTVTMHRTDTDLASGPSEGSTSR